MRYWLASPSANSLWSSWRRVNSPTPERRLHRAAHWLTSVLPGRCYHGIQYGLEHFRLAAYYRITMKQRLQITGEMVRPQVTLVLEAIVLALACSVPDWLLTRGMSVMPSLSRYDAFVLSHVPLFGDKSAPSFFALVAGAVGAMLGLVLALYGIGLQQNLTTYSHEVVTHASKDPVTQTYFRLIVFTEVYCLVAWVRYRTLGPGTGVALVVSFLLAVVSFVGLLRYREFLVSSLHPASLIRQLTREVYESISYVTTGNSILYKSWSIAQGCRDRASLAFDIADQLFIDLSASPRQKENARLIAHFATTCWLEYSVKKSILDQERGAWFPVKNKPFSSADTTQMTLNLVFESEGRGTVSYPTPDLGWFEDRCLHILQMSVSSPLFLQNGEWQATVLSSAKELLSGHYERDFHGFWKQIQPGLVQQWEFEQASRILVLASGALTSCEPTSAIMNWEEWTNMIGAWGACVADGQDYPQFQQELSHLVNSKSRLRCARAYYVELQIPVLLHDLLLKVRDQLAVEECAEGFVITPPKWVIETAAKEVDVLERSQQAKILDELIKLQDRVIAIGIQRSIPNVLPWNLKVRLAWIIKLNNHDRLDIAEQHPQWWNALSTDLALDGTCVRQTDLRTTTEVALFAAAIKRAAGLAKSLAHLWILDVAALESQYRQAAKSVNSTESGQATMNLAELRRARLVVGGYLYGLAELDSNYAVLDCYVKDLLDKAGNLESLIADLERLSIHSIYGQIRSTSELGIRELDRYHPLYRHLFEEIGKLPRSSSDVMSDLWESDIIHPSAFVRRLGPRLQYLEIDDFAEGFLDWLRGKRSTNDSAKTDSEGDVH